MIIFLVIMFTSGVMIIKMSRKAHFFVFFADNSKVHLKDLFEFFQKMIGLIGFGVTVCKLSKVEISKKC